MEPFPTHQQGGWLAGAPPDDLTQVEQLLRVQADERQAMQRALGITEARAYEIQHGL